MKQHSWGKEGGAARALLSEAPWCFCVSLWLLGIDLSRLAMKQRLHLRYTKEHVGWVGSKGWGWGSKQVCPPQTLEPSKQKHCCRQPGKRGHLSDFCLVEVYSKYFIPLCPQAASSPYPKDTFLPLVVAHNLTLNRSEACKAAPRKCNRVTVVNVDSTECGDRTGGLWLAKDIWRSLHKRKQWSQTQQRLQPGNHH